MSGTKFYIYGGGRWREVDLEEGRVEGWGRARFVYPRRGKVHVAKTRAVLTALRDLSAGQNSAVRDGAHLPAKKCEPIVKDDKESACDHPHCCQHSNNNGCRPIKTSIQKVFKVSAATQCVPKTDAGIQTSLQSQTLTFPESPKEQNLQKKRRRKSSSSEDNVPIQVTTNAAVHTSNVHTKSHRQLMKRKRAMISSDENHGSTSKRVPSLKLEKADSTQYNLYKRRRSKSSDSVVWVVLPKNKQINGQSISRTKEYLKTKSRKIQRNGADSGHALLQQSSRVRTSQNTKKIRNDMQKIITQISLTSSDEQLNSKPNTTNTSKVTKPLSQDQCKELIIDETDVDVLRNYLTNNTPNFDLLKFDQDDEYKKKFFFKINPLVNVERCPIIARMMRRDSQDEMSLKDFASQLGLRSVSEKGSVPKRYRMRNLQTRKQNSQTNFTDSETDEEKDKYVKKKDVTSNMSSTKRSKEKKRVQRKAHKHDLTSEDISETEHFKSLKELNRRNRSVHKNNINNKKHKKNLTESSEDDFEVATPKPSRKINTSKNGKQNVNNIITVDNTDSNDTDSEENHIQIKESNRKSLRVNSKKPLEYKKHEDSSEDDSEVESSKERNKPSERINRTRKNNVNTNKKTDKKVTDSSESDVEDSREVKTSKERNKSSERINRTRKNNVNTNKKTDKYVTDSSESDVEDSGEVKTSKERNKPSERLNRTRQNNVNNNKKTDKEVTDSSESDVEDSRPTKKVNTRSQNKENRPHENTKQKDSSEDVSEEENSKISAINRREQNKINKRKNHTDSNKINTAIGNSKRKESKTRNHNKENYNKQETIKNDSEVDRATKSKEISKIRHNNVSLIKKPDQKHTDSDSDEDSSTTNKVSITNKEYKRQKASRRKLSEEKTSKEVNRTKQSVNNGNTKYTTNSNQTDSVELNLRENKRSERKNVKQNSKEGKLTKEAIEKGQNKENKSKNATTDTLDLSSGSEGEAFVKDNFKKPNIVEIKSLAVKARAKHTISKRPSISSAREYSNLEDHAIVSWISSGGRACCVNGNRIWRELQDHYYSITGNSRSWHSLRNRYLRYILPSLGTLALPPAQVARLRAAAATGEIKSRKRDARRNSIFGAPSRGALSRRPGASRSLSSEPEPPPKRHKHDATRKAIRSPSPQRVLRSSLPAGRSPRSPPHSPRYSDITRYFSANHPRNDSTPSSPKKSPTKKLGSSKKQDGGTKKQDGASKKLADTSSIDIIEDSEKREEDEVALAIKKSLRRSVRAKESPAKSVRTRKLYNPGSLL